MLREGAWLANVMPVFGEPWIVPLEFPLFQWCVTILVWATGAPIDAVGRLVSAAFTIACLWPLLILAREMRLAHRVALIAGTLWLAAPLVVFFGRSFLIETMVVFLSVGWLATYVRLLNRRRLSDFAACLLFGILAGLTKPTAFAGFVVVGFIYTCAAIVTEYRRTGARFLPIMRPILVVPLAGAALTVVLPAVMFIWWGGVSDSYMAQNPLASLIRFQNLGGWYFGSWSARTSVGLWDWVVRQRALPDALGFGWLAALYAWIRMGPGERSFWIAATLIVGWLGSFVLFPTLHINHHYYQVENALLILMAAAVALGGLLERGNGKEALAVLAIIVAGQVWSLYAGMYFRIMSDDLRRHPYFLTANELRARTAPGAVIVVFGTGYGADLPYFSDRRGIVPANWFPVGEVRRVLIDERERWFGGRKLGAVVECAVYNNQQVGAALAPIRDALKHELGGSTLSVEGAFYGATVTPPRCEITLPR
jgi:hypothetical protein